jgi:glyoxylase-like metal-dependent hydrolase (beta-lactamase superfamily II)
MKRILKIVGAVVLTLVVVAVAALAPVFLGRRSVTDGVETNGIRIVRDGFVSVAVIPIGEREVALIDAGNDASGQAILSELSRRGLGPDAVTAILVTHGHPDHIAAIPLFPRAEVMALAQEVALIEGRTSARGPLPRLFPARPTGANVRRALDDGETVVLGDTRIRVFGVPGHTAGSAAYLVNGVLFLGDAADAGRDGTLKGSPWVFSDSQAEDRSSLIRLQRRLAEEGDAVKVIVFAHSGTLEEGLAPLTTFAQNNQ